MKTNVVLGFVICGLLWGHAKGVQKAIVKVSEGKTTDRIVELKRANVFSHNVTAYTISGEGDLTKPIAEGYKYNITIYMGEKMMRIRFPLKSVCEYLEKDKEIMEDIHKNSNIPKSCPVAQGSYNVRETTITPKVPPMLPVGCYKIIISVWNKQEEHMQDINIDAAITDANGKMQKKCDNVE